MFEDIETHKKLSKWIIGTFTACILIANCKADCRIKLNM